MALQLTTTLEPRGPAGAIVLTDDQAAGLGNGRKAFPVRVTVNGITVLLRVARMGGENLIGLSKAARQETGTEIGATYDVEITAHEGELTIEVPEDLAAALAADPPAGAAFTGLAYSHRKEFVRWITEAKREATRADRVAKTLTMLREGRTR